MDARHFHVHEPSPTTMTVDSMNTLLGFTFFLLWAMIGQIAISRR